VANTSVDVRKRTYGFGKLDKALSVGANVLVLGNALILLTAITVIVVIVIVIVVLILTQSIVIVIVVIVIFTLSCGICGIVSTRTARIVCGVAGISVVHVLFFCISCWWMNLRSSMKTDPMAGLRDAGSESMGSSKMQLRPTMASFLSLIRVNFSQYSNHVWNTGPVRPFASSTCSASAGLYHNALATWSPSHSGESRITDTGAGVREGAPLRGRGL
jgi:hypothetical protein